MSKKAIFGGSFDPVHKGHISVALSAYRELGVDEVIFMPTRLRYYKKENRMASDEERYAMLLHAVKQYPYLTVSRMELDTPVEENYTVNTLERLTAEHPDWEIYFIIGGDSLAYLDSWRRAECLFQLATFAVAVRDEVDSDRAKEIIEDYETHFPGSRFVLLSTDPIDISSTQIRNLVAGYLRGISEDKNEPENDLPEGKQIEELQITQNMSESGRDTEDIEDKLIELVPESVAHFILEKGIYKG
jgi:nicotinate-nucleotide adenylyltransferase